MGEEVARVVEIERVLRENGLTDRPDMWDGDIHSWRCSHPDIYRPCSCFAELADDLARLVDRIVQTRLTRFVELADDFASNVDWSDSRNNYGDNEAWDQAARQLRDLAHLPTAEDQGDGSGVGA